MKITLIILLGYLFILTALFAQEKIILRTNAEQIKLNNNKNFREAIIETKIKRSNGTFANNLFVDSINRAPWNSDTISYPKLGGNFNTNFGFFGQDVMLMWFEAPAGMNIKGIGFSCSDDSGYLEDGATVGLRLVKLNWTREQLQNFSEAAMQGYYPSDGNGFNNIDAFGEMATGNWISNDENNLLPPWTNHENPDSNSFDYDLWSDDGLFWPVVPVESEGTYSWLDLTTTGLGTPDIGRGEIFAVVAMNNGLNLDSSRIGFRADNAIGYPGWKFYQNGRNDPNVDHGWWVRNYTFDFAVAVEVYSPPYIYISLTELQTTLSTEARTVEVTIEGSYPGEEIFNEVSLVYIINDGNEISVAMTKSADIYTAQIPGQSPGTKITYWATAKDEAGNTGTSPMAYTYHIFKSVDDNNLLVFNGQAAPADLPGMTYPQSYYWGNDTSYTEDAWSYDAWAYGPLTKGLVDNYNNIFEICTNGPHAYNREVIAEWLSESGYRNYFLAGEEWLGADNNYTDHDYLSGSFEYDVLGVAHSYNDVSCDGTSGQELPSKFMPVEGTQIGGAMFDKVAEINAIDSLAIDSVLYNPMYGIGAQSNWHDGFEVVDNAEVFMTAETRGIGGVPAVQDVNVGVSNVTANGNKIVFIAYDPISINTIPDYFGLGRGEQSNTYQAMQWFDSIIIGVDEQGIAPKAYSLSQNYPNPFNPSTIIRYEIPNNVRGEKQEVRLIVYDLLGRDVTTLVNKQQQAGSYEVKFDASNLTSGIYFYRLQSGKFVESRKMILLK